jgi:hypothetical protein
MVDRRRAAFGLQIKITSQKTIATESLIVNDGGD